MELCSRGHDEVCFEGIRCPACRPKDEIDSLKYEIDSLNAELESLESDESSFR